MKTDSGSACALLVDGTVQCWGYNSHGQLGHGDTQHDEYAPGAVIGLGGVTAITLGDYHTCALLADGTDAVLGIQHVRAARQRGHDGLDVAGRGGHRGGQRDRRRRRDIVRIAGERDL